MNVKTECNTDPRKDIANGLSRTLSNQECSDDFAGSSSDYLESTLSLKILGTM